MPGIHIQRLKPDILHQKPALNAVGNTVTPGKTVVIGIYKYNFLFIFRKRVLPNDTAAPYSKQSNPCNIQENFLRPF